MRTFHIFESAAPRYFIVGTQKSGTTWLRDCLDPFVSFCKPEWYYPELVENIRKSIDVFGSSLPQSEREYRLKKACRAAWLELTNQKKKKKSAYPCSTMLNPMRPDLHPLAVRLLKDHFTEGRIVVIVRDPRAVFHSLCHYLDRLGPVGRSAQIDVEQFATEWARQNSAWANDAPHCIVLYENLKVHFVEALHDVLNKLEITHTKQDVARIRDLSYSIDKLRSTQPEIYRTGTVDEWKSTVSSEISAKILAVAKPVMLDLGMSV